MLYIVRGLPGSGKSTLAKLLVQPHLVFEADQYFMHNGKYVFNPAELGEAHAMCFANVEHALKGGMTVAVSNTFTTKKELRPYFALAKKYNVPLQVITCQGGFKSVHDVPQASLDKMKARFEYDVSDLWAEIGR